MSAQNIFLMVLILFVLYLQKALSAKTMNLNLPCHGFSGQSYYSSREQQDFYWVNVAWKGSGTCLERCVMSPLWFWRTVSWEYCRKSRVAAFLGGLAFLMEISFHLNRRNKSAAYRNIYQDCMRSLRAFQRKRKLFRDSPLIRVSKFGAPYPSREDVSECKKLLPKHGAVGNSTAGVRGGALPGIPHHAAASRVLHGPFLWRCQNHPRGCSWTWRVHRVEREKQADRGVQLMLSRSTNADIGIHSIVQVCNCCTLCCVLLYGSIF